MGRARAADLELVLAYQPEVPTPRAYGLDPVSPARSSLLAEDRLAADIEPLSDAELLVVGSRGKHGALRGVLMGLVADYCGRRAGCPVRVVRHAHAARLRVSPVTAEPAR